MSGFNSRVPTDLLLDTGVLSVAGTVVGPTRGGMKFNPGTTMRDVEYDERMAPVVGLDRKVFMRPTFTGTVLLAGPEDYRILEAGGSGTGNTVTPKPAGVQLASGEYLTNVAITWRRSGGGTCVIAFPYAICTQYEQSGTDQKEAETTFTIEARQNRAGVGATDGDVPYTVTITDPS
jgi:hypothetical protein